MDPVGQIGTPPPVGGADLPCPHCGYNLRGIDSARCPECGNEIDWANLSVSRIPWVHREKIGRIRAFLRTAWAFTVHPGKMAMDAAPPDYCSAARFRAGVVWLASAAVIVWLLIWRLFLYLTSPVKMGGGVIYEPDPIPIAEPGTLISLLVCVPIVLALQTGAALYFFRPRGLLPGQEARAMTMGQYACAPLAWTPITISILASTIWLASVFERDRAMDPLMTSLWFVVGVLLLSQALAWWRGTLIMLAKAAQASGMRITACAIITPVLVLVIGIVVPVFVLAVVNFLVIAGVSVWGG